MRAWIGSLVILGLAVAVPTGQTRPKGLDIYVVDVEGGNATLFVSPAGGSVLIDSGNPGPGAARDADRIMAAVRDAGLTQIDNLITTHWHGDHFGGMAELASRVPIRNFIDHGANVQPAQAADDFLTEDVSDAVREVEAHGRETGRQGRRCRPRLAHRDLGRRDDQEPAARRRQGQSVLLGLQAAGSGQDRERTVRREHRHVREVPRRSPRRRHVEQGIRPDVPDQSDWHGRSLRVSHHGQAISNSEVLVHALAPRVGIMNNGTRKGGQPDAMRILHSSPGLEDLWQMHFSQLSGQEYTVPGMFIANSTDEPQTAMPIAAIQAPPPGPGAAPPPAHNGAAFWFKVSAQADGSFTVTNARNGFSKTYRAR